MALFRLTFLMNENQKEWDLQIFAFAFFYSQKKIK